MRMKQPLIAIALAAAMALAPGLALA